MSQQRGDDVYLRICTFSDTCQESPDHLSQDIDESRDTLVTTVELDENDPSTYRASLVDYGNACWTKEHFAVR